MGFPQGTLALDPRWSRVEQTYGEDPFLAAEFVYARCAGSRDLGGASSLESFICHGMGEGGSQLATTALPVTREDRAPARALTRDCTGKMSGDSVAPHGHGGVEAVGAEGTHDLQRLVLESHATPASAQMPEFLVVERDEQLGGHG